MLRSRVLIIVLVLIILAGVSYYYLHRDNPSVSSPVTSEGLQFIYPQTLGTNYISTSTEGWPPEVHYTAGELSCAQPDQKVISGNAYCVTKVSEGAAGSTYTTFEYTTKQGDFLAHVKFTLRFPQCLNYDDPQKSECLSEQNSFDIDGLADRIASSIKGD